MNRKMFSGIAATIMLSIVGCSKETAPTKSMEATTAIGTPQVSRIIPENTSLIYKHCLEGTSDWFDAYAIDFGNTIGSYSLLDSRYGKNQLHYYIGNGKWIRINPNRDAWTRQLEKEMLNLRETNNFSGEGEQYPSQN